MVNSPKFLFALAFQNVNLDWHGFMVKFLVSIQAPLDLVRKKKKSGFEFEFNLNQVHMLLISSNYKMKHCRLQGDGYLAQTE
jgi:hypothetical protein